jgi:hypothetical protein
MPHLCMRVCRRNLVGIGSTTSQAAKFRPKDGPEAPHPTKVHVAYSLQEHQGTRRGECIPYRSRRLGYPSRVP